MSHKNADQLTADMATAAAVVTIGARYRHYKGNTYTVLQLAFWEADMTPCVVYQAEYDDKPVFVRPVTSWLEQVKTDTGVIPRFTPIV